MEVFVTLLLAHILTEYPLQTHLIYRWKTKNIIGVLFHVEIYLVLAILFLGFHNLKSNGLLVGFLIFSFVAHMIIDQIKNAYIHTTKKDSMAAYLVDQLSHIMTLMPAIWLFPANMERQQMELATEGINLFVIKCLLISIIFVIYTSSIWQYYFAKEYLKSKKDYARDFADMGWRLLFFATLFLKPWGWLVFLGLLFYLPKKQDPQKVLLNALCGALGFLLFSFLAF